MAQDIVLTGIISYPNVFVPKQINGRGDPKFSGTLILDPATDWDAAQACVQEAIAAKFPQGAPANLRMPFQPADEDGFPGQWKIHAYGDRQPQVVDQRVQPVMDQNQLFAGCKVNMYVRFYGYDASGNRGVGVGLNAVQILDNVNVKRLDNSKDAKDVFQAVPGAPAQLAPTDYSQPPGGAVPPGPPQQYPGTPPQQPGYAPNPAGPGAGYPAAPPGPPAGTPPAAGHPSSPAQPGTPGAMPWMQ